MAKKLLCPACEATLPVPPPGARVRCLCGEVVEADVVTGKGRPAAAGGAKPQTAGRSGPALLFEEEITAPSTLIEEELPDPLARGPSQPVQRNRLFSWGVALLVVGIVCFVLPALGIGALERVNFDAVAPLLAGAFGFIAAGLLFFSQRDEPVRGLALSVGSLILLGAVSLVV